MDNPTDARVTTARAILNEAAKLHTMGATRADLIYYVSRIESAARMLLDYADDPAASQSYPLPDTLHAFASSDGQTYRCGRCGQLADAEDVWMASVLEECEGGERQ